MCIPKITFVTYPCNEYNSTNESNVYSYPMQQINILITYFHLLGFSNINILMSFYSS